MRYLVISDIHGSLDDLKQALTFYSTYKCDKIIILGDELYHGPRNPIPLSYDPKAVASLLNTYKNEIVAIRGNCDAEVDQMMLEFPIMETFKLLKNGEHTYLLTHGHHIDEIQNNDYTVLLSGHSHIPSIDNLNGRWHFNPGSITFPKDQTPKCIGVIDEQKMLIISLDNRIYLEKII